MPKHPSESRGPTPIRDQAWAAGLYEGEGYLSTKGKANGWRLAVRMTDYDVVKAFHDTIQVGKMYGPCRPPSKPDHHKSHWEVYVHNKHDIFKVICDFYPYVGERRRAKFDEFLTTYGN